MNKMGKALVLALALAASSASAFEYKQGELIVKYKDGVQRTRSSMSIVYQAAGVQKVKRFGSLMKGYEHVILNDNIKVEDAIASLEKSDAVEYVVPNILVHAFPTEQGVAQSTRQDPPGMKLPCFPGMEIPGCDPTMCWLPGLPLPPGCTDEGSGGTPTDPNPPTDPADPVPTDRPAIQPEPAEPTEAADPDNAQAYGLTKIGAPEAWKIHKGSKDMVVAVLDTGIDYNHQDLAFNMWRNKSPDATMKDVVGYNFVHNDALPYDDLNVQGAQGHGAHAAGTIGAVGFNGVGVSGVAPRVSLMAVKFLNAEGGGNLADSIKAYDYAVSRGAKILSNSWGVTATEADGNGPELKPIQEAIARAGAKGVLSVFAAGNGNMFGQGIDNDGKQRAYPASFKEESLIAVAATDDQDKMTTFSNFGKLSVHLAAPGANIYSTIRGNKYVKMSGTSMACPHVAGAAALVWSKRPDWDFKQVKNALISTVDTVADPKVTGKTISGGRLNVLKALRSTE